MVASLYYSILCLLLLTPSLHAQVIIESDTPEFKKEDQILKLSNNWYFSWNKLVEPDEFDGMADIKTDAAGGFKATGVENVTGFGAGSYSKQIMGLKPNPSGYDVYLHAASSAYKFCIFSKSDLSTLKCSHRGQVALNENDHQGAIGNSLINFSPKSESEQWVLLVQVSNFDVVDGGLRYGPPQLSYGGILSSIKENESYNLFISLGFLFAIFAYNFMIWYRRKSDTGAFALAMVCLATMARTLSSNQIFYEYLEANELLFRFVYFIEFSTVNLVPMLFAWFVHKSFRSCSFKGWFRVVQAISAVFVVISTLPPIYPTNLLLGYQLAILPSVAFGMTVLVRAMMNKLEGSIIAFSAAVISVLAAVYDTFVTYGIFPQPLISQFALVYFMFAQGQVIAKQFASAFRSAERLTAKLKKEVSQQTEQIKQKAQEISNIMEAIPEGIVYINDENGRLSETRSRFLPKVFEVKDELSDIHDLLKSSSMTSDEVAKLSQALMYSLGEDSLCWESNKDVLPTTLDIEKQGTIKVLELDWHAVLNSEDTVEKIMLTARDVTELRQLEKLSEKKTRDSQLMLEIIQNQRIALERFFNSADELVSQIKEGFSEFAKKSSETKYLSELYGRLHSLKGLSRSVNMSQLSLVVHDVEEPIFRFVKAKESTIEPSELEDGLVELFSIYEKYRLVYVSLQMKWAS